MNPEIAKDYETLVRQFRSLVHLFNLQEKRLIEYSRRDYSVSDARLKELEALLESEKEMNAILTKELGINHTNGDV